MTPCVFASDMNMYENNNYHFKFSHPSNWKLREFTRDNSFVITTHPFVEWNEVPIPIIEVDIKDYPINKMEEAFSSQSINNLIKDLQDDPLNKKVGVQVTVDDCFVTHLKNKKALFIKTATVIPSLGSPAVVGEGYVIFHNSYRFAISTAGTLDDLNSNRQILKDILNSFEFLQWRYSSFPFYPLIRAFGILNHTISPYQ